MSPARLTAIEDPRCIVLVTDLDRTFTTPDFGLDDEALRMVRRLREAGAACVLATGRGLRHLEELPGLTEAFDGVVAEGGAVWGNDRRLHVAPGVHLVHDNASRLEALGATVRRRIASFGVARDWEPQLRGRTDCSVQVNRDTIDVLPPNVDKGTGLRHWMRSTGTDDRQVVAIGDAENDLPLLAQGHIRVAVGNAVPALQRQAHWTTKASCSAGFVEATQRLFPGALV